MKKIILILVGVFVLSGCSIKYELFYKSEEDIVETVRIGVDKNVINQYADSDEEYFQDVFNSYKIAYGLKKYKNRIEIGNAISYLETKKTHDNLDSVLENEVFNMFFGNKNVYKSGNNIIMELSDYLYLEDETGHIEVGDVNITIKSNYKIKSNADSVNNFAGVYKWTFDSKSKDKTIQITFTDEFNFTAYLCNINPVIWVIVLILIVGGICLCVYRFIVNRNKKNNLI